MFTVVVVVTVVVMEVVMRLLKKVELCNLTLGTLVRNEVFYFCPRRSETRRGLCDGCDRVWRLAFVVCLCVCCPDHGYLWNLHLDFDETWSIVFLGYLKLTQQHLSIFDKYYYPLPKLLLMVST